MIEHIWTTSYFKWQNFQNWKFQFFGCGKSEFSWNYGNVAKPPKNHFPKKYIFPKKCVGKAIKHFIFDYVQELMTALAYICAMSTNAGLKY